MVVSNINSNVSYPERKTIDEDDKGQDVSMFQIKQLIRESSIVNPHLARLIFL